MTEIHEENREKSLVEKELVRYCLIKFSRIILLLMIEIHQNASR